MHSWGTFPILLRFNPYASLQLAVLPDISLISLSIRSYLELAIFREDFLSVASVNVQFSWVFYFVFIRCYKLNSPQYLMGAGQGLFSLGAFPTFRSHDFRHGCLYVESSEEGRGGLKRFVTVIAWKFLKISCYEKSDQFLWNIENRYGSKENLYYFHKFCNLLNGVQVVT